eukprot:CAMPEP_0115303184 /NCGR_PEP_ID=MMETSP0270-20121206/70783_1 /TAXON_ID=71861 /ORGANISM="Scrippsiella trochoidea, Strain CCMP3099" /LENGTH=181 /DNA_ID=CAMNT_0002721165 /DNA_START=30 /DNA_END=575 /DNA_ORIENTATION=+
MTSFPGDPACLHCQGTGFHQSGLQSKRCTVCNGDDSEDAHLSGWPSPLLQNLGEDDIMSTPREHRARAPHSSPDSTCAASEDNPNSEGYGGSSCSDSSNSEPDTPPVHEPISPGPSGETVHTGTPGSDLASMDKSSGEDVPANLEAQPVSGRAVLQQRQTKGQLAASSQGGSELRCSLRAT